MGGVTLNPTDKFSDKNVAQSPHFIRLYNLKVSVPTKRLELGIDDRGKPMVFQILKPNNTTWMTLEASFYGQEAYGCVRIIDPEKGWRFLDASDVGKKYKEAVVFLCPRDGKGYLPETCQGEYYTEPCPRWCRVDYNTYHKVNIGDRMRFSLNPDYPESSRIFGLDNFDVEDSKSFKIWIVAKNKNVPVTSDMSYKYGVLGHQLLPMVKLTPLQWGAGNFICPDYIHNKQVKRPGLGKGNINVQTNKNVILGADYSIAGTPCRAIQKKSIGVYRFQKLVV